MKIRNFIFLLAISVNAVTLRGQSWPPFLTPTMHAILDKNVLTVSTTLDDKAVPDYNWVTIVPWYSDLHHTIHSVVIEDKVKSVGTSAFMHCWFLTSVTLAKSVADIG